jgi:hypothetical protein
VGSSSNEPGSNGRADSGTDGNKSAVVESVGGVVVVVVVGIGVDDGDDADSVGDSGGDAGAKRKGSNRSRPTIT